MRLGGATKVYKSDGSPDNIVIASTAVVYTHSFPMFSGSFFGVWAKMTSVIGTPNIKVELEESWSLPTAEGSAETTLWVEPDGFDDIFAAIADELAHIKTIAPVPMTYGRYKITGLSGNPADTIATIYNFIQEVE